MFIKIKNFLWQNKYTLGLFFSLFLYTPEAAAVFESLNKAGKTIFSGLNKLIAPAATIGIACCCIAGMFGSFNWKWFAAICIGIFVMSLAAAGLIESGIENADLGGIE